MSPRRCIVLSALLSITTCLSAEPGATAAKAGLPNVLTAATSGRHIVALTFDGVESRHIQRILAVLQHYYVPATFFVSGAQAHRFTEIVSLASANGNEIGNFGYGSLDLQTLSTPHVVAELTEAQEAIREATGVVPTWFRPPFGDIDPRIVNIAASLGLRTVTWSVDSADFAHSSVSEIVTSVVQGVRPGSVVLLRNGMSSGRQTTAALPVIIRTLKQQGYRFATLDELVGLRPLPPCVPHAAAQFSRAGIRPHPGHRLYHAWLNLLCRGINLGPATSQEHHLKHEITAQDFHETAHRLEIVPHTASTQIIVMWGWAVGVFSEHHVKPRFGRPITRAWFNSYFRGVDWGPAVGPAKIRNGLLVQRFLRAWAIELPDGIVQWKRHLFRQ